MLPATPDEEDNPATNGSKDPSALRPDAPVDGLDAQDLKVTLQPLDLEGQGLCPRPLSLERIVSDLQDLLQLDALRT